MEHSWRFAAASVQGVSHRAEDTDCDDDHFCQIVDGADGSQVLLLAASDGAGSVTYGKEGSRLGCRSIVEQCSRWLSGGGCPSRIELSLAHEWLDGVRETLAEKAGQLDTELHELAATLIFLAAGPTGVAYWQIGDGAIVVSEQESDWKEIFWPQQGAFASETYFVTDNTAHEHLCFAIGRHEPASIAMFTDGLERLLLDFKNMRPQASAFQRMLDPLQTSGGEGEIVELSSAMASYLASPDVSSRTDDDVTLIIGTRVSRPAAQAA